MKERPALRLVRIAITAALYVALSLVIAPATFGVIQVRFAELLVLLCFFNKDYCYSMSIGCFITNIFSPLSIIDMIFGTIGTIISCIIIRYTRRIYLAWIGPTICTFFVALEFFLFAKEPFWMSFLTIGVGEFIAVAVIGVPVMMLLERNGKFLEMIGADDRYYAIMESIKRKKSKSNNEESLSIGEHAIDIESNITDKENVNEKSTKDIITDVDNDGTMEK